MNGRPDPSHTHLWTVVTLAAALPFVVILCAILWRMPYPIGDTVGVFEDVAERPASSFLLPTSSYYRPLYFITLSAIWHGSASVQGALTAIRFLHIVPLAVLVLFFIWHLRPRTAMDASAASVAVAVLVGAPGLLGNLELPLSYTIVGMPAALSLWMLLEREPRFWHGPAIVALTLIAIGFKEQGLILVPLVVVAWWTGAPGAGRWTAVTAVAIAAAYVVFRLSLHDASRPLFEQDVGLGFSAMTSSEAEERFRAFPLWIFIYNSASTIANVLFAEPTEGVFRFARAMTEHRSQPWHVVYLVSSLFLTGLVAWWGIDTLKRTRDRGWSPESRLFITTIVVLAACGALSFSYSRDRLGGMAAVFYALASFFAVRAAAGRAAEASRATAVFTVSALVLLSCAWQLRAVYTIEFTRQRAVNTQREWITDLHERQRRFADRPVYLGILREMTDQGTAPHALQRTRYPRWVIRMLGEN